MALIGAPLYSLISIPSLIIALKSSSLSILLIQVEICLLPFLFVPPLAPSSLAVSDVICIKFSCPVTILYLTIT